MPLDHILLSCPASLLTAEIAFLNAALAPLGIKEQFRVSPEVVAFGDEHDPGFFWVSGLDRDQQPIKNDRSSETHIAFKARDKAQVDAVYKAALGAGGKDNGAPGVREHYPAGYYWAFVISPGGSNVEALIRNYSE